MEVITPTSELVPMRYLAAQLLAYTVYRMLPNVLLAGGGVNSLGFYYDFIFEQPLTDNMLELIEVKLRTLIKSDEEIRCISMMRENAESLFEHHHQPFLAQRASEEDSNIIDLVQIEDFYAICPAISLTSTLEAGQIKLLDVQSFIQWDGEEEVSITRVFGTTQKTSRDLKNFLKNHDQFLKKKDHRKLGPKLNLFSFSERVGSLGVFWHPKGIKLREVLQNWLDEQQPWKHYPVSTPAVIRKDFLSLDFGLKNSGLAPFIFDEDEYQLFSTPLPQHIEFLKTAHISGQDLPWRLSEYAPVYQQIPESQRWGLLSSCSYLTDLTTIVCTREQVLAELISSLLFIEQIIRIFVFEAHWVLVASRQKTPKARQEQEAIRLLTQAVQLNPLFYPFSLQIEEEEEGGEGPRLELRVNDVLGREWPTALLGVVVHPSEVKELSAGQGLVVLTRRIWGSLDRMVALLIERYEGVLPLWLAPEQVRIMAIGVGNRAYAKQIAEKMRQKGLRVGLDLRDAKLGEKVHEAERENIPYLVLVGDQERAKGGMSVRTASKPGYNQFVEIETFLDKLYYESLSPTLERS